MSANADPTRTRQLNNILERITANPALLKTVHDRSRVQVQALLLAGVFRLIGDNFANIVLPTAPGFGFFDLFKFFTGLGFLQHGGTAFRNEPVIVGESRPELFVPRTAGVVYSGEDTAQMIGGDNRPIHVHVEVDRREIARAVYNHDRRNIG